MTLAEFKMQSALGIVTFRMRFRCAIEDASSPELLAHLSQDFNHTVRIQVALHKNTPAVIIQKLCYDPYTPVCRAARYERAKI